MNSCGDELEFDTIVIVRDCDLRQSAVSSIGCQCNTEHPNGPSESSKKRKRGRHTRNRCIDNDDYLLLQKIPIVIVHAGDELNEATKKMFRTSWSNIDTMDIYDQVEQWQLGDIAGFTMSKHWPNSSISSLSLFLRWFEGISNQAVCIALCSFRSKSVLKSTSPEESIFLHFCIKGNDVDRL